MQFAGVDEVIPLIRKIQRGLEPGHEIEELCLDRRDRGRQRAFELIECRAGLQRRDRIDQIGDRFRLDQIALPVKERRAA